MPTQVITTAFNAENSSVGSTYQLENNVSALQLPDSSNDNIFLGGSNEQVGLTATSNMNIFDDGRSDHININGLVANSMTNVYNFHQDWTGTVNVPNSVGVRSITSDHAGGTMLTLGNGAKVDFHTDTTFGIVSHNAAGWVLGNPATAT